MRLLHRPLRHRGVLVAIWLTLAVEFLMWRQPGFWLVPFRQFESARALADQGRDPEAIAEIAEAVAIEQSNAGYLTFKGYLEARAGRASDARDSFTRALAAGGDEIEIRLGLADAARRLGEIAEAREQLAALSSMPLNLEQRYRRQALHAMLGDFGAALADRALFATDLQDPPRLREVLHWALGARAWTDVLGLADRLSRLTTDDSLLGDARDGRALALDALGRSAEALEAYTDGASPDNLAVRARLASQLQRHALASELYAELLARHPDDPDVARSLAQSLGSIGRLQPAITAYRTALALGDDATLRLELVALLNAAGAHEAAWRELRRLATPLPDPPLVRLRLQTAFWAGRLPDAADALARVKVLSPADATLAADLALALTARGYGPSGESIYRRLIAEGRASSGTRARYAWWLTETKRYEDAWTVLRADPSSATALTERDQELRARVAFWSGHYDAAAPLLEAWTRDHPRDAEAWRDLAETSRQMGNSSTELRALDAYVGLRDTDTGAAARRAYLLDQAGRPADALRAYEAVLARTPADHKSRRLYAHALERTGRVADAINEYARVWQAEAATGSPASSNADLARVVARLARRAGRRFDALEWYERAGAAGTDDPARLAIEVAQAELDAGRPAAAHSRMESAIRAGHDDVETLGFAANAAAAAGHAARAAAHLESLAARRPLSGAERRWHASLYRTIGDRDRALALYGDLARSPEDRAGALEAMGDILFEHREWTKAEDAWRRSREAGASPDVTLKLARLHAACGQLDAAVLEYERYLQARPSEGLRLELARAYLGARRFDAAQRWASEARSSSSERGLAADLVLAQALHLQGRVRESFDLNPGIPPPGELPPDVLELFGQLAAARNRHLQAVRLFDEALARAPERQSDLWLSSAQSALARGDYFRSAERLARAASTGAEPPTATGLRADLAAATLPVVSVPTRAFGDSNAIALVQSGVRARLLPHRMFETIGEATVGALSQHETAFRRTRALVGVSRALVTPTLAVEGFLGGEDYQRGGTLTIGRATVTKHFLNNSAIGVTSSRDSMWSDHDARDPRQFNRVIDLARMGPAFRVQSLSVFADRRSGLLRQSLLEAGTESFQDDNRRHYAYAHHQFVLRDRPGLWSALRPNVYWEHFAQPSTLYFSPGQFVSVGTMFHAVRTRAPWRFETEINPKLTIFDARAGLAAHGLLDVSRDVGPFSVGAGGFVLFDDRANYWAWRLAGQLGLRLGR